METIKTCSGECYSVSQTDIAIFIKESRQVLQKHINHGKIVGLFLDLDNAHFNSLILYQTCVACGASVIRCGISDLDRQLPIKNSIMLDLLICTQSAFKHIVSKVKYDKCILVNHFESVEGQLLPSNVLEIYEFFNIPGFLISNFGSLLCPGYTIGEYNDEEKSIYIKTNKEIEGFEISDYYLNLSLPALSVEEQSSDIVYDYIKLQIKTMLKEVLNGKVDCQENINLNSIGMVELLVKLEEEFEISIPMEKISKTSFKNLTLLSDLLYSTITEN